MANRAFMYASDLAGFPCADDRLLRGRNYAVPLLWLASADVEHIRLEEDPDEPDEDVGFTCLCIEVQRARQLLWRRRAALEALIENIGGFLDDWTAVLESLPERYVKFEISEVLDMHEPYDDLLSSALRAFDEPSERHWAALVELVDLGVHFDPESRTLRTPPATTARELMARFGAEPSEEKLETVIPPEPADQAAFGYAIDSEPTQRGANGDSAANRATASGLPRNWPLPLALTVAACVLIGPCLVYVSGGSLRGLALGGTSFCVGLALASRSAISLPAYVVGSLAFGIEAVAGCTFPWGAAVLLAGIPGARDMLCEARGIDSPR